MNNVWKLLKTISLFIFIFTYISNGQTWEELQAMPKPMMKGLDNDSISIEVYGNDLLILTNYDIYKLIALSDDLKLMSKLELRKAGIKVANEKLDILKYPNLYISIQLEAVGNERSVFGYAYSVSVGLRQKVILARDKNLNDYAITWKRIKTSYASSENVLPTIKNTIKEKINEFIIEYLKAKSK